MAGPTGVLQPCEEGTEQPLMGSTECVGQPFETESQQQFELDGEAWDWITIVALAAVVFMAAAALLRWCCLRSMCRCMPMPPMAIAQRNTAQMLEASLEAYAASVVREEKGSPEATDPSKPARKLPTPVSTRAPTRPRLQLRKVDAKAAPPFCTMGSLTFKNV